MKSMWQRLQSATVRAKETAYKAVMKPKEGTILTVARGMAEKAEELAETTEDLDVFIPEVIVNAQDRLFWSRHRRCFRF